MPVLANRVDHLGALSPVLDKRFDQRRWVLQVGIEHDDNLAAGRGNTRRKRGLFAKIARQPQEHQSRNLAGSDHRVDPGSRIVGTPIVDDQNF